MAAWLLSLLLMDAMYEPGSRVHGARPHRDSFTTTQQTPILHPLEANGRRGTTHDDERDAEE